MHPNELVVPGHHQVSSRLLFHAYTFISDSSANLAIYSLVCFEIITFIALGNLRRRYKKRTWSNNNYARQWRAELGGRGTCTKITELAPRRAVKSKSWLGQASKLDTPQLPTDKRAYLHCYEMWTNYTLASANSSPICRQEPVLCWLSSRLFVLLFFVRIYLCCCFCAYKFVLLSSVRIYLSCCLLCVCICIVCLLCIFICPP